MGEKKTSLAEQLVLMHKEGTDLFDELTYHAQFLEQKCNSLERCVKGLKYRNEHLLRRVGLKAERMLRLKRQRTLDMLMDRDMQLLLTLAKLDGSLNDRPDLQADIHEVMKTHAPDYVRIVEEEKPKQEPRKLVPRIEVVDEPNEGGNGEQPPVVSHNLMSRPTGYSHYASSHNRPMTDRRWFIQDDLMRFYSETGEFKYLRDDGKKFLERIDAQQTMSAVILNRPKLKLRLVNL